MKWDQLERERKNGTIFEKFEEAPIDFLPTYKFIVGTNEYYSNSEKLRRPAYTDRILWRSDLHNNMITLSTNRTELNRSIGIRTRLTPQGIDDSV